VQVDPRQAQEFANSLQQLDLPPVHVAIFRGAKGFVQKFPVRLPADPPPIPPLATASPESDPVRQVTSFLWAAGLALMLFVSGVAVSEEADEAFGRLLEGAQVENRAVEAVELRAVQQSARYHNSRGFLGFTCNAACQREKIKHDALQKEWRAAKEAQFKALSAAKSQVGVWSVYAVQEARDLFWGTFAKGKAYAKRASMWDLLFVGLDSMGRDEGLASFVIRIIFNVLINFTMGLIGALVAFIWYLWDVIRAYQPDPVTAVVSFCVFAVVATSMVATYLLLLYGTVASTGYMMVRAVANSARIEGGASNATRGHLGDGGAGHSTASSQPNSSERTSGFADAPSQSSAEDLATDFPIGRRVKVIGLASRPELNGQTGRVKSLNEVTVPCSQSKQYS